MEQHASIRGRLWWSSVPAIGGHDEEKKMEWQGREEGAHELVKSYSVRPRRKWDHVYRMRQ